MPDGDKHKKTAEPESATHHENTEHYQSDIPHTDPPKPNSKKTKGKDQKSSKRNGAYKLPTIVTYVVPHQPNTSYHHMPFDALADDQKTKRQAIINTIVTHWNHDPNTWLPRKHRPDNMPEDPRDRSGTYLSQLAKLAEGTTGDVDRAQVFLESAARHWRHCPNGKLSGEEIRYAVDRCQQAIGAERERKATRTEARAHQEARQDSEHETSAVHKPASFAGFNATFKFSTKPSHDNRQDDVDMTHEVQEDDQEERNRQMSSAFDSLNELADGLPSNSENANFPSFGAAAHTMSTIQGSNMVNAFHGQTPIGHTHPNSVNQQTTLTQRTMTNTFGQPSQPLRIHIPQSAHSPMPFRKYSGEPSSFARIPSLTTAPWSAPQSAAVPGRQGIEAENQHDQLSVEAELQQQERHFELRDRFEQSRKQYRDRYEEDEDEDEDMDL